jgi:hypothetical protein
MESKMNLGTAYDEEGLFVSLHICDACGTPFSVCPPVDESTFGGNCLAPHCKSYEVVRDQDFLFGKEPN